eukprot:376753-Pleurochrysis_carterae.AAC.1
MRSKRRRRAGSGRGWAVTRLVSWDGDGSRKQDGDGDGREGERAGERTGGKLHRARLRHHFESSGRGLSDLATDEGGTLRKEAWRG